jgi:ParB/RepB/Spo0J family partition protein
MAEPIAEAFPRPAFQSLALELIRPSPTNPRKVFHGITELAASMRERGVDTPLVVRPAGGAFELVAGERRYRAAGVAGLSVVPVQVRELTDQQARDLQMAENLEREDLSPLEEAQGYADYMKDFGLKATDVAKKFGRSHASVSNMLRLLDLGEAGRALLEDGKISASLGLLIARIPGSLLQSRFIAQSIHADEVPSYRQAKELIERNFMVSLKDAPFNVKDAQLVPAAGACTPCPKRTGNLPDLGKKDDPNRCTDPLCFRGKVDAVAQLRFKKAEESGQQIMSASQAEKVFAYGQVHYSSGFTETSGTFWQGSTSLNIPATLKKHPEIPTILAQEPQSGRVVELVQVKALEGVLPKKKKSSAPAPRSSSGKTDQAAMKKRQEEEARTEKLQIDFAKHAMAQLAKAAGGQWGQAQWLALAQLLVEDREYTGLDDVLRRRSLKEEHPSEKTRKDFRGALPKMDAGDLRGVVVELAASLEDFYEPLLLRQGPLVAFLQAFGIDVKKSWTDFQKAAAPAPGKKK